MPESYVFSPLSPYVFVHFHIKIFPHPIFPFSFISFSLFFFEEESLNFTNIPCYLYSALNHLAAVKLKKKNSDGTTSL